jgi:type I restriction enzyme, S subunit
MSSMNFLEKLLDGVAVEWKPLGKLAENLDFMRKPVTSGLRDSGEVPYYGASGIVDYVKDYIFDGDFLLVSEDGANLVARNTPIAFSISGKSWVNNHAHILKFNTYVERRYVEYYLNSIDLTPYISGAAQPKLNQNNLNSIKIPNPSLAIQAEIVRILDTFTALTAELTAELTDRKKQYEYYRDRLLTFEEGEVEWKTLLDACDYVDYRGKTPTKTLEGIFLVTAKNIRVGYIDYEASQEFISEDDYALVMRRGLPKLGDVLITTEAPCGFVAQVDRENIALAQRVIKYRSKDKRLSNSFLKHYLLGSHFQNKLLKTATGSTVKGIKGSKLHQLTIPIPSEAEQTRIVAILDKFDTLTTSISEGLPREIALRQKQYEYYRDLLLSFPKTKEEQ